MKNILILISTALILNTNIIADEKKKVEAQKAFSISFDNKEDTSSEVFQKINSFFKLLANKKTTDAFRELLKHSAIGSESTIKDLAKKSDEAFAIYGDIKSQELIQKRIIGENLMKLTYLSHSELHPMQWKLYWYKSSNKGKWIVLDLRIDNSLKSMFDEKD